MAQRIISLMSPHEVYIEPFLGAAAVMRAKKPAAVNIGLDMDPDAPGLRWMTSASIGYGSGEWYPDVGDGLEFLLNRSWTGQELIYCDPPYLQWTRTDRRLYKCEWDTDKHRQLLQLVVKLPCRVMLSGYPSELYKQHLTGWNSIHYDAMTRGGTTRDEWLWFNFEPPTVLHDYRYLGEGYRERERIKKKTKRWVAKLEKMPLLERQALLAAMEQFR